MPKISAQSKKRAFFFLNKKKIIKISKFVTTQKYLNVETDQMEIRQFKQRSFEQGKDLKECILWKNTNADISTPEKGEHFILIIYLFIFVLFLKF